MELDPITKWLIRISSSIIIALGLFLLFLIPLFVFKAISIVSLVEEILKSDLKDILTGLISKI